MNESILTTIRQGLSIDADYGGFDGQIMIAINSAIMSLSQLNIGPPDFKITGTSETWSDLYNSVTNIEAVKSYILLKTRLEFDPPTTSFLLDSIDRQIKQLEWRLMVEVDPAIP